MKPKPTVDTALVVEQPMKTLLPVIAHMKGK